MALWSTRAVVQSFCNNADKFKIQTASETSVKQRALPCGSVVCKLKLHHLHSLAWDRDEALSTLSSKLSQVQMQLQDELHQCMCMLYACV